jgi:hypothetical protein
VGVAATSLARDVEQRPTEENVPFARSYKRYMRIVMLIEVAMLGPVKAAE